MTFLSNIKRALGFGGDEIADDETYVQDNRPGTSHHPPGATHAAGSAFANNPDQQLNSPDVNDLALKIFDNVVAIFNDALPSFLAKSVDPQAQKKYILENLEDGVRNYIENVHQAAVNQCNTQWAGEKEAMQKSVDEVNAKNKQLEAKSNEMREKQLSAERQKRALSDRCRDLETAVAKLEAEKEQYELEAKSLINKAKVATVYEKEIQDLTAQLNDLRAKNLKNSNTGNQNADAAPQAAELKSQIADKDAQIETLKAEIAKISAENSTLNATVDALGSKNKDLREAVDTLSMKDKMSVAMVNDMQSKASGEREHAADLEKKLNDANAQIADLAQRLEESEMITSEFEELAKKIEGFQQLKEKLEGRINQLRESLKTEKDNSQALSQSLDKEKAEVLKLNQEIESLNTTIRENLMAHAKREDELQQQIADLKAAKQASDNERRKRSRSHSPKAPTDTSDIDDILGDTEWFVSTPPKNKSLRPDSSEATNDFGYQEPPRRPQIPENDAQMSLF